MGRSKIDKASKIVTAAAVGIRRDNLNRLRAFQKSRIDSADLLRDAAMLLIELWEKNPDFERPLVILPLRELREVLREHEELKARLPPIKGNQQSV